MVWLVMAATKTAAVARRPRTTPTVHEEPFSCDGRAWVWREGPSMVPPAARAVDESQRAKLVELFLKKLVPQAERRGIAAEVFAAAPPSGVSRADVRWVRWFREGEDPAPLWALFVQARVLAADAAENDAWTVVAWGDGPALAWASDERAAQACVRSALRAPPPWLLGGMASRDPSFAVRIERAVASPRRRSAAVAVTRATQTATARGADTTNEDARESDAVQPEDSVGDSGGARGVLAAWRRAHPARSA
jgi:hypothetical protein